MTEASFGKLPGLSWWRKAQEKFDLAARVVLVFTAFATPISTAAMNAGFALLLILFVLAGRFRQRFAAVISQPVVWLTLAFFAFICLGATWTIGPLDEAGWQISKYSKLLLIPLVMSLAVDRRTRAAVLFALLAALLLTMILTYVNALQPLPAWLSRATREGVLTGNNYIFKHHIIQNVFLSFGALLCFVIALSQRGTVYKLIFAVLGVACTASVIFMAQGRTGYLTLVAVLSIATLLLIRRHPQLKWAAAIAVMVSVLMLALSPGIQKRVTETIKDYSAYQSTGAANAIGHRLLFWETSVDIIRERPIFGAGTGAYRQEFLKRVSDPKFTNDGAYNPHNQYLYFGTQLGVVGMLAFVGMLVVCWGSARRLLWPRRALAHGTVAILAIYSMFDSPLFITEGHFFVILLGTLWAGTMQDRASGPSRVSESPNFFA